MHEIIRMGFNFMEKDIPKVSGTILQQTMY